MNDEDYNWMVTLHVWLDTCQHYLDYADLTDEQIHEIAIERDLAAVILWHEAMELT